MDCPECGGRLVDYRLGDRDAVACEDCGYVGIDAEHRGRSAPRESWDDAIERFRRRQGDATDERASDGPAGDEGEPDERPDAEAEQASDGRAEETESGGSKPASDDGAADESDDTGADDVRPDDRENEIRDDDVVYLPAVGTPVERSENGAVDEE